MKEDKDNFLAAAEEAKQRLAAGEKPDDVFDQCWFFHEGFAAVKLNGKFNYIDSHGNIMFNTWFDDCSNFDEGFALVKLNDKWNFINRECNYLSDTWLDDCWGFHKGFAPVGLNGRVYYLRNDGTLCDYNTKEPIENKEHTVASATQF